MCLCSLVDWERYKCLPHDYWNEICQYMLWEEKWSLSRWKQTLETYNIFHCVLPLSLILLQSIVIYCYSSFLLCLLTLYKETKANIHTCWEVCVFSQSITLLHTHTHSHIIFFSRQSQSCHCQMLICYAAAGGFSWLSGESYNNYIIKNLLLLLCNNFTFAFFAHFTRCLHPSVC